MEPQRMSIAPHQTTKPRIYLVSYRMVNFVSPLLLVLTALFFVKAKAVVTTVGTVTTIAGNTTASYSDGYGSAATFNFPNAIAISSGASFALVSDSNSHIIRRIEVASGRVSTIAGLAGQSGYADGTGSFAVFNIPHGIALGAAGSVAVTTEYNNRVIRSIDIPSARVVTVAGSQQTGYADGTAAMFVHPTGIALDAAASFALVCDASMIRRVNLSTGAVTTLAGTLGLTGSNDGPGATARFFTPVGLAMDAAGTFALIADRGSHRIRRIAVSSAVVTTFLGSSSGWTDGVGTAALFWAPSGVAISARGDVAVIIDNFNHLMRLVNVSTGAVSTLAGQCCPTSTGGFIDGVATAAAFRNPFSGAVDASASILVVADTSNSAVRSVILVPPSPSPSSTATASPLPLPSQTGSPSGRDTPTSTQVATTSMTPSSTPSPDPFILSLAASSNAQYPISSPPVIALSDSYPPSALQLWLSRCPEATSLLSAATISCEYTAMSSLGQPPEQPSPTFVALGSSAAWGSKGSDAPLVSRSAPAILAAPCEPASADPVMLAPAVWTGALFRATQRSLALVCRVGDAASGRRLAHAVATVSVQASAWPLWDDAIVVSASGVMRSARLGLCINATGPLRAAVALQRAASGAVNATELLAAADCMRTEDSLTAVIVLRTARSLWSNISLPNASAASALPPFSVTLSGKSRIVLRSLSVESFRGGDIASLGGVSCNISAVSDDGAWAVLDTPTAESLCGSRSRDCGYAVLSITSAADVPELGVTLSCPPFCPGAVGGGIVPVATGVGTFVLGAHPSVTVGALPSTLPPPSAFTSEGMYYAVSCSQTGVWTDPATGSCQNAFDPASFYCAFGGGGACVACPVGALCPGGSRLWTRVGYWAPSDASSTVTACAPPDAERKCGGWDVSLGAVRCGAPYRPGSYLCGACAGGFYPPGDGACTACPSVASAWDRYGGFVVAILAAVGAASVVGVALGALVYRVGGTLGGATRRLLDLVQWAVVALQTVSQAAPASTASLPPSLGTLFRGLAAVQVQGGALLPSACTGDYAFAAEAGLLGSALGLTAMSGAAATLGSRAPRWLRTTGKLALRCTLILLPAVSKSALTLVDCVPAALAPAGAASLDGGVGTSSDRGAGLVTVSVLVSNPLFSCWAPGGSHRPVGVLAIVAIIVCVGAFPLVTLAAAARAQPRCSAQLIHAASPTLAANNSSTDVGVQKGSAPADEAFVASIIADYIPDAWYTRHMDMALTLLLAALQSFLPNPSTNAEIAGKAAAIVVAALSLAAHTMLRRPFNAANAWKTPVRAALLCLTAACACMNAWTSAIDAGLVSSNSSALAAGAALLIALFCCSVGALVFAVGGATFRGIREEQSAIEARLLQAASTNSLGGRRMRGMRDTSSLAEESEVDVSFLKEQSMLDKSFECANPSLAPPCIQHVDASSQPITSGQPAARAFTVLEDLDGFTQSSRDISGRMTLGGLSRGTTGAASDRFSVVYGALQPRRLGRQHAVSSSRRTVGLRQPSVQLHSASVS